MKKLLMFVMSLILIASIMACGGGKLTGLYEGESGQYSVQFERSGEVTWYQDGKFFKGTYESTSEGFQLEVLGGGMYDNTIFKAVQDGNDLIITGGTVKGERFVKS